MAKKRKMVLVLMVVFAIIAVGSVYAASRCNSCGGTGFKTCSSCRGTGDLSRIQGQYLRCNTCGGSGVVYCRQCGGDGIYGD
jgi:DnaJ-class molecular chaperone